MNIIHLKYAIEVAKAGSINKAGETLNIAQPNISRALKDSLKSLGLTLDTLEAIDNDPLDNLADKVGALLNG